MRKVLPNPVYTVDVDFLDTDNGPPNQRIMELLRACAKVRANMPDGSRYQKTCIKELKAAVDALSGHLFKRVGQ